MKRNKKNICTVIAAALMTAALVSPSAASDIDHGTAYAGVTDWPIYIEGTWQQAYLNILETDYSDEVAADFSYALIYIDNDDIPEMLVNTNFEAGGNQVFTWKNGMVDKLQTSRLGYSYIDRGNLFENTDGIMGNYYTFYYAIQDGRWVETSGGSYDADAMQEAAYYPKEEIKCVLNTGRTSSVRHRYELIRQNCTWWEAKQMCEAKGGYLATLTTQEEFDKITDAIRKNDLTKYKFYVGANNAREDSHWGYYWHDPLGEFGMITSTYIPYWLENEPSYSGEDSNQNEVDEDCVTLIYLKDGDYFCLNDVAYDLIAEAPFYSGSVGYICEYDY